MDHFSQHAILKWQVFRTAFVTTEIISTSVFIYLKRNKYIESENLTCNSHNKKKPHQANHSIYHMNARMTFLCPFAFPGWSFRTNEAKIYTVINIGFLFQNNTTDTRYKHQLTVNVILIQWNNKTTSDQIW